MNKIMKISMVFLILIVPISATYVKNNTKVHVRNGENFAILFDSTFVLQSNDLTQKPFVEVRGYTKYEYLKTGKLKWMSENRKIGNSDKLWPTRTIRILDTVLLFKDSLFKKPIGKAWPIRDTSWISFDEMSNSKNITCDFLSFWLYGVTDSSSILEFQPWINRIGTLYKNGILFNMSFDSIDAIMRSVDNDCIPIDIDASLISYAQTSDEGNPESNINILYIFYKKSLQGVWISNKIGENGTMIDNGYFYYSKILNPHLKQIKKVILQQLNCRP